MTMNFLCLPETVLMIAYSIVFVFRNEAHSQFRVILLKEGNLIRAKAFLWQLAVSFLRYDCDTGGTQQTTCFAFVTCCIL